MNKIKLLCILAIIGLLNSCNVNQTEKENKMNAEEKYIVNPSEEAKRNAEKNPFGLVYDGAIEKK